MKRFLIPSIHEINARAGSNGLKVISTFAGGGGSSTGYKMAGYEVLVAVEFVDKAAATYRANAPSTHVIEGDIRQVTAEQLLEITGLKRGELDVLDGSPPCFTAGTLILTSDGFKPIEDVSVGDMVLTHKQRWRRVVATMVRNDAETVVARGMGAPAIRTTPEHPFYVRRQRYRKKDEYSGNQFRFERTFDPADWVEAKDLHPDLGRYQHDKNRKVFFWATPAAIPALPVPDIQVQNSRSHKFSLTPEFMWFVGAWVGDGWLRTGKTHGGNTSRGEVLLCGNKKHTEEMVGRLERAGLKFSYGFERTAVRFVICSKPLATWLEDNFGRYSGGKRLPAWLYGLSEEMRRGFLDGYLFADGSTCGKHGAVKIATVSRSLAVGAKMLFNSLGMSAGIQMTTPNRKAEIEGRPVSERPLYDIVAYQQANAMFADDGMWWGMVKSITPTGVHETVYNFEVEEDNSYVADGVVVHNCQGFAHQGLRDKGWGKELSYSGAVSQRVDDLFFEFVRLVDDLQPKVFVAENVVGLTNGVAAGYFKEFFKAFEDVGYVVGAQIIEGARLGVPQMRNRVIFVGVRKDLGIIPVFPTPFGPDQIIGLRDAIEDLPPPADNEFMPLREGTRTRQAWAAADVLEENGCFSYAYRKLGWGNGKKSRWSWFRLPPHRPVNTVTAKTATICHWAYPRTLSIPEIKRVSTFPDDYVLTGNFSDQWERIGRAVPPLMMFHIANTIAVEIFGRPGVVIERAA